MSRSETGDVLCLSSTHVEMCASNIYCQRGSKKNINTWQNELFPNARIENQSWTGMRWRWHSSHHRCCIINLSSACHDITSQSSAAAHHQLSQTWARCDYTIIFIRRESETCSQRRSESSIRIHDTNIYHALLPIGWWTTFKPHFHRNLCARIPSQ